MQILRNALPFCGTLSYLLIMPAQFFTSHLILDINSEIKEEERQKREGDAVLLVPVHVCYVKRRACI